ncbi:endonuclease [Thiovibrio frasassiensis]|uniref:Endonuclease n=1 Tax=Thiovibrio frasassiensis TaxID=2984131 RepID=A0A9X4MGD2_9BACT|nr:endonuclease [Thiovibrio frasassiensis]MDG4475390.1 endonuclease [Thiovibrio frasassiensis]
MKRFVFLLLLIPAIAIADDSRYHYVRDTFFWPIIYNHAYEDLYCGRPFPAGKRITVEHVYPADWIAEANECKNRKNCDVEAYRVASSDLHNLWPAEQRYNSSRSSLPFGVIPENTPRFNNDECDFERTTGENAIVEPRDEVKGDIARSMLYMIWKYKLPDHGQTDLMLQWNMIDPPTDAEKARYKKNLEIQGNSNPYIEMWE